MKHNKPLKPGEENFCQVYIENGKNATEAYRQAFPNSRLWKRPESATERACRLVKTPRIDHRIREIQEELRKKSDVKKEEVLRNALNVMRTDIRDFFTIKDGEVKLKDSEQWTPEMSRMVEGIKMTKYGAEPVFVSRTWAIDRICKMLGFDASVKMELTGKDGEPLVPEKTMTQDQAREFLKKLEEEC